MVLLNMFHTRTHSIKKTRYDRWNIIPEEGREVISQWREKRLRVRGARKAYHEFLVYSFDMDLMKSFLQNINFMVVIQMIIAVISVYIFQRYEISFNLHVSLIVSPIVFPLAFSINTDFQRKEKVLEDLAVFKSSGMVWYFCMREWKHAAELDDDWINAAHTKLKSLLFHLREYLLTFRPERRKLILRCMYEDFSDTNQLIERVRASKLPANTAIVSRSVHLLNMMCLSFERLRVVREYRSPRSIRSFNKVFIMFLPIILSPYFVFLGNESKNVWQPYYMAILVAFVFSALQGAQDKLDDPFDGISEDDIDLDTIDEWTFSSLEHTMKRTFDVGRFKVTVDPKNDPKEVKSPTLIKCDYDLQDSILKRKSSIYTHPRQRYNAAKDPIDLKKFAPMLENMSGSTRITRKSIYRTSSELSDDVQHEDDMEYLETIFEPVSITNLLVNKFQGQPDKKVTFQNEPIISPDTEIITSSAYLCEDSEDVPLLPRNQEIDHPFDCFPEQEYIQGSTAAERLCSHNDQNVAIDTSKFENEEKIPDTFSEKKQSQIETCNTLLDDPESSHTHGNTNTDSVVNRFCVESSENNSLQGSDNDKGKKVEKNIPSKEKFNVTSVDKLENVDMSNITSRPNNIHSNNVTDNELNEDNIFSPNTLPSNNSDSFSNVEAHTLTHQSPEELNMPSVVFSNGTAVKNKPDITVNVEHPSVQTSETDTGSKGVLDFLGNTNRTNTYSSSNSINNPTEPQTRDSPINKDVWEF